MKRMKENTIAQFFVDSGFIPPKGRSLLDMGFGFDTGVDANMEMDGYDGIPDTILDVTKDLDDGSEHPAPGIYADYYMFNDPGTRTEPDGGRSPISQQANQLNMEYHKKDLSRIESASDVHIESLEQPSGEFPRHAQIRSQMEPSVLSPEEVVLEQPTMIEGTVYPAGTKIFAEGMVDLSQLKTTDLDKLFEDAGSKMCPLCHEPYEGDACPCVKDGKPMQEKSGDPDDPLYRNRSRIPGYKVEDWRNRLERDRLKDDGLEDEDEITKVLSHRRS